MITPFIKGKIRVHFYMLLTHSMLIHYLSVLECMHGIYVQRLCLMPWCGYVGRMVAG
jgi:hypothetical protein